VAVPVVGELLSCYNGDETIHTVNLSVRQSIVSHIRELHTQWCKQGRSNADRRVVEERHGFCSVVLVVLAISRVNGCIP
jgi:hypothetical protein